jgi:hypothetical protein
MRAAAVKAVGTAGTLMLSPPGKLAAAFHGFSLAVTYAPNSSLSLRLFVVSLWDV